MRLLPLRASEQRRENSAVAKKAGPTRFERYHATVNAHFTAGDVRASAHQSPTAMKPHDVDPNDEFADML